MLKKEKVFLVYCTDVAKFEQYAAEFLWHRQRADVPVGCSVIFQLACLKYALC